MRWDKIGTTSGPTRIGGTTIPAGSELLIPIAEPGDIEDCLSCRMGRDFDERYPADEAEQFRLHLERHLIPRVRYREAE